MNMLARHRNTRGMNLELSTQAVERSLELQTKQEN